ncbi:hypothetical protein HMP0721_1351 [Pseudoramibacter alactolyticus ATCC 23263]|uniref:Uncharacterized protein n=1 Tax=Pseudoramibacter alactolyticus ATCC 23263 TaxID=887929 RepID=E6MH66_9FIRM|nr:hypothetical protein HMP0721_1351 [Pseudoramibacter alactolyticus ATCC 23263]
MRNRGRDRRSAVGRPEINGPRAFDLRAAHQGARVRGWQSARLTPAAIDQ